MSLLQREEAYREKALTSTQKLAVSGLVMAVYIVVMYFTQSFAFGAYQIRIATALYALAWIHPFLALPLSLANCLSNMLMGGLGIFDTLGGVIVGLVTTGCIIGIRRLRLPRWLCGAAIVVCISLVCATWLSHILGIPYPAMALNLFVGELIPGIVGVLLIQALKGLI